MKLFFDFFPIFVFFLAYKFAGIYAATAVFIFASALQVGFQWFKNKRVDSVVLITFILSVILGGATLFLHDERFIKWKPTILYWAFSCAFLFSHYLSRTPLIARMLQHSISLPSAMWIKLNWCWCLFFLSMGFLNLYVMYYFDTNTWVNFKLFGCMGLTLVFIMAQLIFMSKHLKSPRHPER